MTHRARPLACALALLVQAPATLEACPWKKALAAAMALVVLGGGQALPKAPVEPGGLGGAALADNLGLARVG